MIGDRHLIDIVFLSIGDHFTMGPGDALPAADWYGAKLVVLVYNSFPRDPPGCQSISNAAWRRVLSSGVTLEVTKERL